MLKQNNIPYLKKAMLERSRFYVPIEHLSGATAVLEDLFFAAAEADNAD